MICMCWVFNSAGGRCRTTRAGLPEAKESSASMYLFGYRAFARALPSIMQMTQPAVILTQGDS